LVITRSQYLVTKPKFLLQRLTEFLPDKYNFYTGDLLNCLDRANIIQDMKRLLGWLRYRKSCVVEGTIKNIIVSCVAGKWYASIQTEREVTQPLHSSTSIIGIDLGVTRFATLSDGTVFEPVNALRKYSDTLAKHQRCLSRKTKFSSNWKKQKQKISRLHHRVAQTRHDFLHKTSILISKNHAMIVLEDLKVTNMSKSASGTVQAPGRCVKAKSGLNKSILDQGWGEFRRQLEYKQAWRGGEVLAIDPSNTSRTCPACKHVSAENRTTQAKFECVECGFAENADLTAAINIVRAGHARLACQVNGAIIPSATGTHRSDRPHPGVYAVGIPVLEGGEEVNGTPCLSRIQNVKHSLSKRVRSNRARLPEAIKREPGSVRVRAKWHS
jgi:IS605 OrfB family transposase